MATYRSMAGVLTLMKQLFNDMGVKYGLDPRMLACVAIQESNLNPYAIRFEPHIHARLEPRGRLELAGFVPRRDATPNLETEKVMRACSFGLMQVLGETARWLAKFQNPYLTSLLDPAINLDVGCQVLLHYKKMANQNMQNALAFYNGGKLTEETRAYAQRVMQRFNDHEFRRVFDA